MPTPNPTNNAHEFTTQELRDMLQQEKDLQSQAKGLELGIILTIIGSLEREISLRDQNQPKRTHLK